jgi:hypothetical protein
MLENPSLVAWAQQSRPIIGMFFYSEQTLSSFPELDFLEGNSSVIYFYSAITASTAFHK